MPRAPQVGDQAPDFALEGTAGTFTLAEHRGQRVVLLFYPGDNTAVCTRQFCSYRDRADDMGKLDAVVVGISSQSVGSHEGFRDRHGLNVPLLADEDRAVAKLYGATGPLGVRRATIVIDEGGVIRHRDVHALGLTFESVDDIAEALSSLAAPTS
jgi:thioredoxin-dependent peroxiredoxin